MCLCVCACFAFLKICGGLMYEPVDMILEGFCGEAGKGRDLGAY